MRFVPSLVASTLGLICLVQQPARAQNLDELMRAVQQHQPAVVAGLLARRADLAKSRDVRGETALYQAAYMNRPEEARMLVVNGADVNGLTKRGTSILVAASTRGSLDIAHLLLDNGATLELADEHHKTALAWACKQGDLPMITLLLARGANTQARDDEGRTPLHLAALEGRDEAVAALMAKGVDLLPLDVNGKTPYDLARLGRHGNWEKVVNLLARAGGIPQPRPVVSPKGN